MAADAAALLAATRWQEGAYSLREYAAKFSLPQVARVAKSAGGGGGGSTAHVAGSVLGPAVFLLSAGRKLKVAAQCVKLKDGRTKITPVGAKLAIPDTYNGWFEILSEDGRSARVIESVVELSRRCPDSCVVRDSVKAFVGKGDGHEALTDKVRVLTAGETLVIVGEVVSGSDRRFTSPAAAPNPPPQPQQPLKGRFLRCFDHNGESVFLSLEQKGRFSPVAREDSVSGVHNIRQLLRKRFPLMVRLVHGAPPRGAKNFLPEMRLYASFEEECLMALPLTAKDRNPLVALPLSIPVKVQGPLNPDHVTGLPEHGRLNEMCLQLLNEVQDKIQVFDITLSKDLRVHRLPLIRRSVSDPSNGGGFFYHHPEKEPRSNSKKDHIITKPKPAPAPNEPPVPDALADKCYDEIDQIYDYVRGFAPLPKAVRSDFDNNNSKDGGKDCPPPPPPIESIPARRHSAPPQPPHHLYDKLHRKMSTESSSRPSLANGGGPRFIKSPAQGRQAQRCRLILRQSSKPGSNNNVQMKPEYVTKEQVVPCLSASNKGSVTNNHSPLFNIRYKSLTNLVTGDGSATVASSNSAGSGSSAPREKRSRARLVRPRSLNNLLWDLQRPEMPSAPSPGKRLGTLYM